MKAVLRTICAPKNGVPYSNGFPKESAIGYKEMLAYTVVRKPLLVLGFIVPSKKLSGTDRQREFLIFFAMQGKQIRG